MKKINKNRHIHRTWCIAALSFIAIPICAKLTVTKLTCNYQAGMAVTKGGARLGWQITSDKNNDRQTAYQILVKENVTNKKVFDSGRTKSDNSQLVDIPHLHYNKHGYKWQVRVWDADGKASEWSASQYIRVVPEKIDAKWIGAITRKDAKIPEGRYANSVFKKEDFKKKWADTDTLSTNTIDWFSFSLTNAIYTGLPTNSARSISTGVQSPVRVASAVPGKACPLNISRPSDFIWFTTAVERAL